MQHAPAVTYRVGKSASLRHALLALWLLGLPPALFMLFQALALEEIARAAIISVAICAIVWLLTGLALWQFWARQGDRSLRWDGAQWWLEGLEQRATGPDDRPGQVTVRLDLQRRLLLRWRADAGGRSRWLWADAGTDCARWHLLRCALYSKTSDLGRDPEPAMAPRA